MQNIIWKFLLSTMFIVVLWFSIGALYKTYLYVRQSTSTQTTHINWSVKELYEDRFILHADYEFSVKGKLEKGNTDILVPSFLNQWAAEKAIPDFSKKSWFVWYSPSNPAYSTLQKNFPLKECISSLLLLGVFLYFLWLQTYVARLGK